MTGPSAKRFELPQFYILAAAYFGHLLVGVTVSSLSVAYLTERGVTDTVAVAMLSLEALVQTAGRAIGGLIGDLIDPRYILIFALAAAERVGAAALSMARDYPMLLTFAIGKRLFGFGPHGGPGGDQCCYSTISAGRGIWSCSP